MTHRQVLALAARLAEHGLEIAHGSRGIRVTALRRYLKANQTRFHLWSARLLDSPHPSESNAADSDTAQLDRPNRDADPTGFELAPRDSWPGMRPILEEVATTGVLLRVTSTLLYAIGQRADIPLAMDVARHTAEAYHRVVQAAMASLALRSTGPANELQSLNRLGRVCDRLSDLLCGTIAFHLRCNRFVVDAERATDFGETFGRFAPLIRLPVQKALGMIPPSNLAISHLGDEIEGAIFDCLPAAARLPNDAEVLNKLAEVFRPRRSKSTAFSDPASPPALAERSATESLVFPAFRFARRSNALQ